METMAPPDIKPILSLEEQELILCFRQAAPADRQAIVLLLSKYRHLNEKTN